MDATFRRQQACAPPYGCGPPARIPPTCLSLFPSRFINSRKTEMTTRFGAILARSGATAAFALAALAGGGAVHAAGTLAGTPINNLATLNYSVGGVTQNAIGSTEGGNTAGAGTPTSFVVDNKVNLSVGTTDGGPQSAIPSQA